jgi:hypothetical protein
MHGPDIHVGGRPASGRQVEAALTAALLTDDEMAVGAAVWATWPDPLGAAAWTVPADAAPPPASSSSSSSAPHSHSHHRPPALLPIAAAGSLRALAQTHVALA